MILKIKMNNRIRLVILASVVFSLFGSNIFGQPENAEKIARAKILFDEALALNGQRTAKSYREAREKFRQSNRLYSEAGDKSGAAKSLVGIGITSDGLEEPADALIAYETALLIFQQLKDNFWEARTLNNIGSIYDKSGAKQKALEYYSRALPLRRAAGDSSGEAVTLNSIGVVYLDLGENEKALEYFNTALLIRRLVRDKAGEAVTLNNIGRVFDNLGDRQKALEYHNLALPLRRAAGNLNGEATTLNNIGLIYADLGESQKALGFYNQSLKIFENAGDKSSEAITLNNIGAVYSDLEENQKAVEFYNRALELYISIGNKSNAATTHNNLGLVFTKLKNKEKALENFNRALPILREIGEKRVEAITLGNLMLAMQTFENPQLAIFYGKQSVNKYQELRLAISGLEPEIQKTYLLSIENTYRNLADLLIEQGRFAQAEQVLAMLKEEEYFDFVRRDADEIKSLKSRVALTEQEQKLIDRYLLLAQKVTEIGQKFQKLDDKKRQLSRLDSLLSPEEQKIYEELSAQLSDANAAFKLFLEKELVAEIGKQKAKEIEVDRNLQAKLRKWGNGTVALYTVVSENRYRVILTTPTVQIDGKTEISAADLNKKIFAFREALKDIEIDPLPLAKELYDILLKPVEKDLRAAEAKTLIWSLDGSLRYIPVAALSPDGRTYLVEKYKSAIITLKTRDDLSDLDNEWRVLGVGVSESLSVADPEKRSEKLIFSALPGTKDELLQIIRDEKIPNETGILTGRRFLDKDFNLRSFSDALSAETADGKRKYTAVHIASHFQLGNNWTNSFLLLGDGQILTLEQISNSPEITFGDVELITLSACNTAFADQSNGKEIDSLAEAIQTKSGKSVLATLWAVTDESTPLLMREFYRVRKENPFLTKAEAMQIVQNKMINGKIKPGAEYIEKLAELFENPSENPSKSQFVFDKTKPFAHPYFWSPFVLIGNWR